MATIIKEQDHVSCADKQVLCIELISLQDYLLKNM